MKEKKNHSIIKKSSLVILTTFFIIAGINHFLHPQGYIDLIPPYLPDKKLINILSGCIEIVGGTCMIFSFTRKSGAYIIIALLVAFIPAHIYMIQLKGCVSKKLCVPEWIAWVRLFPFQFILIWWAWKTYKWNTLDI